MIGAISGDIIGSIYEFDNIKTKDFVLFGPHPDSNPNHTRNGRSTEKCFFTDDTVLTVAVAQWLLNAEKNLEQWLVHFTYKYSTRGYGRAYMNWVNSKQERIPYNSCGNGSAMRVSPVAWFASDETQVMELAKSSAEVTHNHSEGIKGAQATALAIWLARKGKSVKWIKDAVVELSGYDLSESIDEIREWYSFHVTCQKSVPQAIICALEAISFEDAIRNAVSIGGDSDTIAAIAGSIAEGRFGVPRDIQNKALLHLPQDLKTVVKNFTSAYCPARQGTN
jgi:ADP-ribosylglycohydrolase